MKISSNFFKLPTAFCSADRGEKWLRSKMVWTLKVDGGK